jgi:hypothetical protein
MSYTEVLHIELFCRESDRGKMEQLGFAVDPDFRAAGAVRMTRAGSRPLVATLMGIGTEGTVLLAFVTGATAHPPGALAADGTAMSFVPCDHESYEPIVRVAQGGGIVGVADAAAYWTIATTVMGALGLTFAGHKQHGRQA